MVTVKKPASKAGKEVASKSSTKNEKTVATSEIPQDKKPAKSSKKK